MDILLFDLQRFSVMPTLLNGEDGGGVRYWNTILGAEVSGFGNTFFVNHGAGCVIYCDGDNTKVYNDTVAPNVVVNGAGGRDWLINDAVNVTLNGNAGKDDLLSYADNVELYGGEGDDAMQNRGGSYVTLDGGADNDWIYNTGSNVTIDGGAGADNIENHGDTVSVTGGENDDHIYNSGKKVTIEAGAGDDHIGNTNSSVTIKAGTGKDSIYNDSGAVKIYATDDNIGDYFYNEGSKVTITAGAGDDLIDNRYSNAEHTGSNVTIKAGDGKNTIKIDGGCKDLSVTAGNGDDSIVIQNPDSTRSGGSDVTIEAGDGNNKISNGVPQDALVPGDLLIVNEPIKGYNNVKITAGANDDEIQNLIASNVTIDAGNGKNKITIAGDSENISVKTGSGNDSIFVLGESTSYAPGVPKWDISYVTIETGAGNNLVEIGSGCDYGIITGGNSSKNIDAVKNKGSHMLITGGEGLDIIENSGNYATVVGGADGDMLINSGNNALIYGDGGNGKRPGNDYIYSDNANNVTIDAGTDADSIDVYHDVNASVLGGAGNDQIFLHRVSAQDFNNLLTGFSTNIADAFLSFVPKIPLTLSNTARDWAFAVAGKLWGDKHVFLPGKLGPWLTGVQGIISIFNNAVTNYTLNYSVATVNGGTGDDTVVVDGFAPRVFEYADGDGNDEIHYFNMNKNFGGAATHLSTLYIKSGTVKKITLDNVKIDSADVMIQVGDGSIRLVSGDDKKFKLRESDGKTTTLAYKCDPDKGDTICSIFGGSEDEIIKDTISGAIYRNALFGGGGNDLLWGNTKNDTLYGGAGTDKLLGDKGDDVLYGESGNDTLWGGDGNDTLWGGTGDDSLLGGDNNDTLSGSLGKDTLIGGKGDDSLWGGNDADLFLYADGDGKDSIRGIEANDTLEVTAGLIKSATISGSDVILTIGTGSVKLVDGVNKKFNLREADGTTTTRAYGKDSSGAVVCSIFGSAKDEILTDNVGIKRQSYIIAPGTTPPKDPIIGTVNKNVIYGYGGKDTLVANDKDTTLDGGAGDDILRGGDANDVLNGGYGKDKLDGGAGADTLDGGAWDDTLTGGYGADTFIYSGGKDVITDYGANFDKIQLNTAGAKYLSHITGVKKSGSDVTLTFSNDNGKTLTLNGAANKKVIVNGATRIFDNNVILTGDKQYATLTADFSGTFNGNGYKKVDASVAKHSTTITGANHIIGGKKADLITGTTGDDTLTGGRGADTFTYTGGKDVITDYVTNFDKIQLNGEGAKWLSNITGVKTGGSDVTLTFSNDNGKTLTLNGARGKKVIVNGVTRVFDNNVISTGDNQYSTLTADFSGRFDGAACKKVDASAVTNPTTIADSRIIIGGKKADYIYGTAFDDTLSGGLGDDKLWGDTGADTFVYADGDGKDIIYGFGDTDMLKITGAWSANYYSGSGRVVFKVGSTYSAITLENPFASTFNVNGNTYAIRDGKFVKK